MQKEKVIIDPGEKNLTILIENRAEIYFFKNIKNLNKMTQLYDSFLKEKLTGQGYHFIFEGQHHIKNRYIEGVLAGVTMSNFNNAQITRLKPYFKHQICKTLFSFDYVKARSLKRLKSFPDKFLELLSCFNILISTPKLGDSVEFEMITDLLLTKKTKYDDIVDVVLFYLYLEYKKKQDNNSICDFLFNLIHRLKNHTNSDTINIPNPVAYFLN